MSADAVFDQVRTAISRDLTIALKTRDRVTVGALRRALNTLDNATATSAATVRAAAGPTFTTPAETTRRTVARAEMEALLLAESQETAAAAVEYRRLGQEDRAERLRVEAAVIRGCLKHVPPDDMGDPR